MEERTRKDVRVLRGGLTVARSGGSRQIQEILKLSTAQLT